MIQKATTTPSGGGIFDSLNNFFKAPQIKTPTLKKPTGPTPFTPESGKESANQILDILFRPFTRGGISLIQGAQEKLKVPEFYQPFPTKEGKFTPRGKFEEFVYGKEPIKSLGAKSKSAEKFIEEKTGLPKEAAIPLGGVAAFGGTLLELLPFGGARKKVVEELANSKTIEKVIGILRKNKVPEEFITKNADMIVKETNPKVIEDLLKTSTPSKTPVLSEVDEIITSKIPEKTFGQTLKELPRKAESKFLSKYSGLSRAESQIYKDLGVAKPELSMGKRFELTAGAEGKAISDIANFKNSVVKPLGGDTKALNQYLFLKRTQDRLLTDPNVKKVGTWTVEKAKQGLDELKQTIGDSKFNQVENIANKEYQEQMRQALRLQVESGRLSEKQFKQITSSNDFYAPFKVLQKMDEIPMKGVGGSTIATTQDYTKAITGIKKEDFQIGDIVQASSEAIVRSRILAEKNKAMIQLGELVKKDVDGKIFKKVPYGTQKAPNGYDLVSYLKDGKEQIIQMPDYLANVLKYHGKTEFDLVSRFAKFFATPLRAGATGFNLAFQVVNKIRDTMRLAIMSKYGVRNVDDLIKFPMDFIQGMYSSMKGNFGNPDALYKAFLDSGSANSTIQRLISPKTFKRTLQIKTNATLQDKVLNVTQNIIDSLPKFTNAIEESSKITAFKRGLNFEKISKLPPAEREAVMQKIASEVRNFGGSPDFARSGTDTRPMNLIFMFFNARIQGVAADVSRLMGMQGGKTALKTWTKMATLIGTPTIGLDILNHSPEYIKDYEKIPQTERDNYWMIPRNKFFTGPNGEQIRDYYRVPKGQIVGLFANLVEDSLNIGRKQDVESVKKFGSDLLSEISPINFSGRNASERIESVISSTNPLIKSPIEYVSGRNMFFHTDVIPRRLQGTSPELQYKKTTPEIYKKIGNLTGQSPIKIQQLIGGLTGGGLTQFTVGQPSEGRSAISEFPIAKRFVRSDYVDESGTVNKLETSLRKQKDESVTRTQKAEELYDSLSKLPKEEANAIANDLKKTNPLLFDKLKDVATDAKLGLTYEERLIKQLQVNNGARAEYIYGILQEMPTREEKNAYVKELKDKKIISQIVFDQIKKLASTE